MRRSPVGLIVAVAAVSTAAWTRGAHEMPTPGASCGAATLAVQPATPVRGALFRVRVSGVAAGTQLTGVASGEPLHFTPDSAGFVSFAPVAIDNTDSVRIVVRCSAATGPDSIVKRVRTAGGNYPMERLTVAPEFGTPPDPATAARIAQESDRATTVGTRSHMTPRLWSAPFVRPLDSRITSGFGGGREYNGQITSRHLGTDFAGAIGTPVKAANRGVVRIVDAFYNGGNVVYVDHGAGLTTAYLHLSKQLVQVGDTVERGQVIGRVGATGRVTGPHLHLIVRYGAVTVDPLSLLTAVAAPAR